MAILKPDITYNWNGLKINEYLLTKHNINKIDIYKQKMIMQNGAIIDIKEIIDINSDIFKNIKFE